MSPIQPTDTFRRVIHGGSWYGTSTSVVRAAFRFDRPPSFRLNGIGFRCAQRGARVPLVKETQ